MSSLTEISSLYKSLLEIATTEFTNIVESGEVLYSQSNEAWKLRLNMCDGSFIDIYYSLKGKYSYHWDRSLSSGKIYRHDNAPHSKWKELDTFPSHFHDGSDDVVVPRHIPETPESALREFLNFAIDIIAKKMDSK